ncbi:hypothetical protein D3C85_469020 [compost metagenome]
MLKTYFNFLTNIFNFEIKDIEDHNHALYVKFISSSIGIYFIYEFRDFVPQIQFTKLNEDTLKVREGLYTIREFYKDENFKLQSFYLDEILSFKGQKDYKSYFKNVKTIEEAIKISSELVETYAMDYVKGNELSYIEIDRWYRTQVNKSTV